MDDRWDPAGWTSREEERPRRTEGSVYETAIRGVVAAVALAAVGAVVTVASARMAFPYPLEWMEGGLVLHVRRVLHGGALYVQPSVEFTPFIYPPLYVYASAAVATVTGLGFLPLRLVSIAGTVGCGGILFLFARHETGRLVPALLSVGLFAATYPLTDTWFDLARVDMLFLLFALATVFVLRVGRGARAGVTAGVLFVLAALTKQSALIALGPVGAYLLLTDRRLGRPFVVTAGALTGTAAAALEVASGGWFLYYVLFLPTGHEIVSERLVGFWTEAITPIGVGAAVGVGFVLLEHRRRPPVARFYALVAAGFVGAAFQARLHSGGWENTLIPAYAAVAMLFGPGVDRVSQFLSEAVERRGRPAPTVARSALMVAVLLQFAALGYAPADHVPTAADREQGRALEQDLRSLDGPAYSPIFPYLAVRAGHEPVAHKMALVDVLRGPPHDARGNLRAEIGRTMVDRRYATLALHNRNLRLAPFTEGYRYDRQLGDYDPVAGVDVTPQYVFVPGERVDERDGNATDRETDGGSVTARSAP